MERLRGWLASHRVQAAAAAAAAIILALCLGVFFVGGSSPDGKADAAGSDASVAASGGDGADERGGSASADGKEGGPPAEASEGESSSSDSKSGSKGSLQPKLWKFQFWKLWKQRFQLRLFQQHRKLWRFRQAEQTCSPAFVETAHRTEVGVQHGDGSRL